MALAVGHSARCAVVLHGLPWPSPLTMIYAGRRPCAVFALSIDREIGGVTASQKEKQVIENAIVAQSLCHTTGTTLSQEGYGDGKVKRGESLVAPMQRFLYILRYHSSLAKG